MIDYAFKAKVIASGLCKIQKDYSKSVYANLMECYGHKGISHKYTWHDLNRIHQDMTTNCPNEWKEAKRINNADYARTARLKKRIAEYLQMPCIFLTITFTDETLENTNPTTRKKLVERYLASFSRCYVANIDFGKKNKREHYHAVIQAEKIDYQAWRMDNGKPYGTINGQKIRNTQDNVKIAKYINKLTNHAIKETTQRTALIYSKKIKEKKVI